MSKRTTRFATAILAAVIWIAVAAPGRAQGPKWSDEDRLAWIDSMTNADGFVVCSKCGTIQLRQRPDERRHNYQAVIDAARGHKCDWYRECPLCDAIAEFDKAQAQQ